jgi:hypothetical protein
MGYDHVSATNAEEYENKIWEINERISEVVFGQDREKPVEGGDLPRRPPRRR